MMPTEPPDTSSAKVGSTTCIMIRKPPPSGPSRLAAGTVTPAAVTGAESLPRRPRPSNGSGNESPFAPRGTSQSVLASDPAVGRLDQTYAVAWRADVTQ